MRTIGIDLAITAMHKAVAANEQGKEITPLLSLATEATELANLLRRAREGAAADAPVRVIIEPTSLAWVAPACYYVQRGVLIHLVTCARYRQYPAGGRSAQILQQARQE